MAMDRLSSLLERFSLRADVYFQGALCGVHTVGAGDTFCGYLAAGLDRGLILEDALRLAAAAGSLACLKAGAQPAIPLLAEVEAALRA